MQPPKFSTMTNNGFSVYKSYFHLALVYSLAEAYCLFSTYQSQSLLLSDVIPNYTRKSCEANFHQNLT